MAPFCGARGRHALWRSLVPLPLASAARTCKCLRGNGRGRLVWVHQLLLSCVLAVGSDPIALLDAASRREREAQLCNGFGGLAQMVERLLRML